MKTVTHCLSWRIYLVFTSLDLSGAYLQLALEDESMPLTTVNTLLGLFQYTRLPYGVKSAPALFQGVMDQIINAMPGTVVHFDDLLIAAKSMRECIDRVKLVLHKLNEHNIKVNFNKCKFFENKLEYLGHVVSYEGICPSKAKTEAIINASVPKDITGVRSFFRSNKFLSKIS